MCQATLAISEILVDGNTQCRATLDQAVIDEYVENLDALPPAVVFNDGTDSWLADGYYRRAAHIKAGRVKMVCIVHEGTLDDARWYAAGANRTHGMRRSSADKEKAVKLALSLDAKRSDSDIANHCGVALSSVARYRADLKAEAACPFDDDDDLEALAEGAESAASEPHFTIGKVEPEPEKPEQPEEVRVGKDGRAQRVSSGKRSDSAKKRHSTTREELEFLLHPDVLVALDQKKITVAQAKSLAKVPQLLQAARLEELLRMPVEQVVAGHISPGSGAPPANEKPSGPWAAVHKLIGQLARKLDTVAEEVGLATNGTAVSAAHEKLDEFKQIINRLQKTPERKTQHNAV